MQGVPFFYFSRECRIKVATPDYVGSQIIIQAVTTTKINPNKGASTWDCLR